MSDLPIIRRLELEIAEYRLQLAEMRDDLTDAEARLAAVLALVLPTGTLIAGGTPLTAYDVILLVRAAATGDTT